MSKNAGVKILSVLSVIMLGLFLSGCGQSASAPSKAPIRIGQATALTTEYVMTGQYLSNGAKMAVDEINANGGIMGRKVELVQEDAQNTNPAMVNAVNKLVDSDNVLAILGPDLSTQNFAAAPIINKAKIPMLVQGTNVKLLDGNSWYFRLRPDDGIAAKVAVKFSIDTLHKKNIAIAHDTDEFGVGGKDLLVAAAKQLGVNVVDIESFNSNDKDLTAQLTNMKNKGAQSIIVWGHGPQQATMMRQNVQLGINLSIIGSASMAMPSTLKLAGESSNGMYAVVDSAPTQSTDPKVKDFVDKYRKLYHDDPDFHAPATYDGVYLLKMAIEKAGSTDADAIRKALLTIRDYHGASNDFSFKDGNGVYQCVVVEFKNGAPLLKETVKLGQ
ncbi:MAG: ABC transporter substrate-binding protein [Desulfitobacteriaceae bacterium]